MVTRREVYNQVDEQRRQPRQIGTFEQHLARGERHVANRGKAISGGVRRGARYIGKHRRKFKRRPWSVAGGMAARTGVAAVAGAGHTVGYAGKKAGQGVRRVSPKVAGLSRRAGHAAHAYSSVYGGAYGAKAADLGERAATSAARVGHRARSRAVRHRARVRSHRRRVAGRMQHHAEQHRQQKHQRLARALDAGSAGLNPQDRVAVRCTCGQTFRTERRAANHQCPSAIASENAAIERARQWQPAGCKQQKRPSCGLCGDTGVNRCGCCECRCVIQRRTAIHEQARKLGPTGRGSSPSNTSAGGQDMKQPSRTGKFIPATGFEPADYEEWMGFLYAKAAQHKSDADGLQDLAERMDNDEGMDPRTLMSLYMGAESEQVTANGYITSYAEFWKLYQNRLEQDGDSGRAMKNEKKFFGQK